MCARMKYPQGRRRPGSQIPVVFNGDTVWCRWGIPGHTPFARTESLDYWHSKGWVAAYTPAEGFAERHRDTGELVWARVENAVGLKVQVKGELALIITQQANALHDHQFGHGRVPVKVGG